jgi:hypothetical protein
MLNGKTIGMVDTAPTASFNQRSRSPGRAMFECIASWLVT